VALWLGLRSTDQRNVPCDGGSASRGHDELKSGVLVGKIPVEFEVQNEVWASLALFLSRGNLAKLSLSIW